MGSGEGGGDPAFLGATMTVNRRTLSRIGIITSLLEYAVSAAGCCVRAGAGVERTKTAIGTRKGRMTYDAVVGPRRQPILPDLNSLNFTPCPDRRAPGDRKSTRL